MAHQADRVIVNGRVLTMDASAPRAEAVAMAGGVILAVGSTAEMRALAGPGADIVDAGGSTVLPGFIDSHVHLFQGSAALEFMTMDGVMGFEAVRDTVRRYAADNPDEPLIVGTGTSYGLMIGRNPTRADLDDIMPDRPLALLAPDIHTVWANTMALEAAGLLHGAPVPEGSIIVMGEDGKATGELLETGAFGPVLQLSRTGGREMLGYVTGAEPEPPATEAERASDRALITKGLKHAASFGITTMHNMDGNFYQLELLSEIEAAGGLACRMEIPMHLKNYDPLERIAEADEMRRRYNSDTLWSGRVKMFMDGVMETRTALMLRDYPDTPGVIGEAVFEPEHFNEACRRIDALGLQIAVHAIGDLAVRRTLDGYEAARKANGARDSRHRIEHIELIDPADIPRLAELGAVASMQPRHAAFGGYFPPYDRDTVMYDDQLPYAFAWQRLRDAGARMVFSTDWPVVPVDVMGNVQAAVAPVDLGAGWDIRAQSLLDTLESYTAGNAWVAFREGRKGQLVAGQMADVVIMDRDLEAEAPEQLHAARPVMTICGGRVTYSG
ncbi:amidohydrolase [Roseovarius sp. LXJ103]|uniref:amidohydrolase n=1 Tax=Roseovarius carneus TaxID=2853164 RepID=UPI000D617B94|nr:amidohydrolase [Roseovarius carneus]MBZ8118847.1 amidohydrolase [Roseovarius carneus]PWE35490.1 amidohydrolase [Pelagicola sp. LXJ1103]